MLRSAAEREATNAPLQGSAADLMKLAMVRIDRALDESELDAAMLLQIHDELIFEVRASQLNDVANLVRKHMEGAIELSVPLEVTLKSGRNWYDVESLPDGESASVFKRSSLRCCAAALPTHCPRCARPTPLSRSRSRRREAQREHGLMDRTAVAPHTGMIFVFDRDDAVAFWMKNTLVPLDMIFVGADGTVRRVSANVPVARTGIRPTTKFRSSRRARNTSSSCAPAKPRATASPPA